MKEKVAKSFKVPKISRKENKDNLRQVEVKSRDCQEIVNTVRRTYVNSSFETIWTLKSAAFVENRELEEKYRGKKCELKEEGRNARDVADHYAVQLFRDNVQVPDIVKYGVRCRQQSFNGLGDSKCGLYLWRSADVQLRVAEGWTGSTCTMIIYKIMYGKCKTVAPPSGPDLTLMEPTPNYDCHVPQNTPRPSDPLGTQMARSQIYLYEYTEDCEPSSTPRQCLPYAVLMYEKPEKVSKSLGAPVDRYSVRPSERKRAEAGAANAEPAKESDSKKLFNPKDARLAKLESSKTERPPDPRFEGLETGLCVPRLTTGLPVQTEPPLPGVVLPNDPRSQLSFLAHEGPMKKAKFSGSQYKPSFGPSDDEEDEEEMDIIQNLNALLQKPKMPSLPPIDLPLITDTRQLTDPRFEILAGPQDPRLENKPSDPRLERPVNPRLDRSQDSGFNRPQDPRLNRSYMAPSTVPSDPRLRRGDPRLTRSSTYDSELKPQKRDPRMKNQTSSLQSQTGDDSSRTKKKLSLQDYKKKVIIEKPVTDTKETFSVSKIEASQENPFDDDFFEDVDMRQIPVNPPQVSVTQQQASEAVVSTPVAFYEPMEPHHASIILQPNVDDVKFPQSQTTSVTNSPEITGFSPQLEQTADDNDNESNPESLGDIVHDPEDMALALNELSDPDDASQSPKHPTSAPDMNDPALSEAMKKLVEHSANVNLFTEALRSLQESAEEYGERLHDPEFLVKKIAERIEILTAEQIEKEKEKERLDAENKEKERIETERLEQEKLKVQNLREQIQAEMSKQEPDIPPLKAIPVNVKDNIVMEIQSPDSIRSPDRSSDSKYDAEMTVKHIPLESAEDSNDLPRNSSDKSALTQSMQKTLEEFEKVESKKNKHRKTSKRKSRRSSRDNGSSTSLNLDSIPMPTVPPQQPKDYTKHTKGRPMSPRKSRDEDLPPAEYKPPLLKSKHKMEVPMDIVEDDDEDIDLRSGFPNQQNILEARKQKSHIKINLKMNMSSEKNKHFEMVTGDEDLRKVDEKNKLKSDDGPSAGIHEEIKSIDNSGMSQRNNSSQPDKKTLQQFGMFESDSNERNIRKQMDHRKLDKVTFSDPFGLGITEDIDDRIRPESAESSQKGAVTTSSSQNDFGDVDFRTTDTSAENSQQDLPEDFDFRKSHSRSLSPPNRADSGRKLKPVPKFVDPFGLDEDENSINAFASRNISTAVDRVGTAVDRVGTAVDRVGTATEKRDMEEEPVSQYENSEVKYMTEKNDDSQDSNSTNSSGMLFDAYSLGKKSENDNKTASSKTASNNAFGDIDWRKAASEELGDMDMRAVPSETTRVPSEEKQVIKSGLAQPFHTIPQSNFHSEPFNQLNKSLQDMFSPNRSIQNKPPSETTDTSYNTAGGSAAYGLYNPQIVSMADSYNTASYNTSVATNWQGVSVNAPQQGEKQFSGVTSLIKNLDFSNLKNILATVQQPNVSSPQTWDRALDRTSEENKVHAYGSDFSSGTPVQHEGRYITEEYSTRISDETKDEKMEEQFENTPAFERIPGLDIVTGKSKLEDDFNYKDDVSLRTDEGKTEEYGQFGVSFKYSSMASHSNDWKDTDSKKHKKGQFDRISKFDKNDETSVPAKRKWGDSFERSGQFDKVMRSGQFDKVMRKSESTDGIIVSKRKADDKKILKLQVESESPVLSTPKNKIKYDDDLDEEMTPLPNISYQSALLESMEQSALKVRSDDSFVSELHEEIQEEMIKQDIEHSDKSYMPVSEQLERTDRKRSRKPSNENTPIRKQMKNDSIDLTLEDDDDDDEDGGLVIDLDTDQRSSPVEEVKLSRSQSRSSDKADQDKDHTDLVNEGNEDHFEIIQEKDNTTPQSKDEMTSMIEKSRKNMVIKLKGETKKVNPKTGKIYDENAKGSAIEVVGQAAKVNKSVSEYEKNSTSVSAALQTSTPISGRRSQSPLHMPHTSPISTFVSGNVRAPSPVNLVSSMNSSQSIVSPTFVGGFSHMSQPSLVPPLPLVQLMNTVQQPNAFVHPYTGHLMQYGVSQPRLQVPGAGVTHAQYSSVGMNQMVPVTGMIPPGPRPVRPISPFQNTPSNTGFIPAIPNTDYGVSQSVQTVLNTNQTGLQTQHTGMAIQTVGGKQKSEACKTPTSSDPFDWFSDKFEKRAVESKSGKDANSELKKKDIDYSKTEKIEPEMKWKQNLNKQEPNYEMSSTSANKQIKLEPQVSGTAKKGFVYGMSSTSAVKQIPLEPQSPSKRGVDKKRSSDRSADLQEPKKLKTELEVKQENIAAGVAKLKTDIEEKKAKSRVELDRNVNEFGSRILESLSEVKSIIKSKNEKLKDTKETVTIDKVMPKEEPAPIIIDSDQSELEDGEISDDSGGEDVTIVKQDMRIVQERSIAGNDNMQNRLGGYNRHIGGGGYVAHESPKRIINISHNHPPSQIPTIGAGSKQYSVARHVGADWADILQNPDTRSVERVRATAIESPSLRKTGTSSSSEESDILSKSVASINKAKQKVVAQSQVKTLGEWLKIELETDNIQPLAHIIPYSLNTDLSVIPKARRRKIRLRVKTVIEQEGLKRQKEEQQQQPANVQVEHKPVNPHYSPELHNDELEHELALLGKTIRALKESVAQADRSFFNGQYHAQGGVNSTIAIRMNLMNDKKMIIAMALVESEMKQLLSRPCFFGYPHRRVPSELLLATEMNTFRSNNEDVFLILMTPISTKPYHKLIQMKHNLQDLYAKKEHARNPFEGEGIHTEINSLHNQRQSLLRSFTGYLNKKRIQKIQETVDKYTMVYDHFKSGIPPTPDSMLKHIRTTQMDLRQHLILAKQYLAMEEMKMEAH